MQINLKPSGIVSVDWQNGNVTEYSAVKGKVTLSTHGSNNVFFGIVGQLSPQDIPYTSVLIDGVAPASMNALLEHVNTNFRDASGDSGGIPVEEKGQPNGVATLDSTGTLPLEQVPNSVYQLKGEWNAATNTPNLITLPGKRIGWFYEVTTPGDIDLGDGKGSRHWALGDWAVWNGNYWHQSQNTNPEVTWNQLAGKPTTVDTFGITNAVTQGAGTIYLFEASRTADTVGDVRLVSTNTNSTFQRCSVANGTKGAGGWTSMLAVSSTAISDELQVRANYKISNKTGTGGIIIISKDATGTEAVANLANIGKINMAARQFADNAAAVSGGLVIGDVYKTADGTLKIVV